MEQELSTLRQGPRGVVNFYDKVENRLTLIINKAIMTNEGNESLIESLNQKYRQDALRVFISGLCRPMCDILFSCKPLDMATQSRILHLATISMVGVIHTYDR